MVITTCRRQNTTHINKHIPTYRKKRQKMQCKLSQTPMWPHRSHHSNYIKGHEVQAAPVARHGRDSFLWQSEHSSSQTLTPNDQWHYCRVETASTDKWLYLTMVIYQLLTTVSSKRVTEEKTKQDINNPGLNYIFLLFFFIYSHYTKSTVEQCSTNEIFIHICQKRPSCYRKLI